MTPTRRTVFVSTLLSVFALALPACNTPPREAVLPAPPNTRTLTIDADHPAGKCYPFWIVANYNKPHALLEPNGIGELLQDSPLIREINCVYLLGGRWENQNRWLLAINPDGSLRTDFTGMIQQLKVVLDAGFTPRIVLDNVPEIMSDPPKLNVYGNTAPPKDERLWHRYVQAAVEAMVAAFGKEKVVAWTFRVGTEPDLNPAHWAGTKEQYLAHYDFTVDAVRRILPTARIGPGNILTPGERGPGTRPAGTRPADTRPANIRGRWGLDVIDHAATGTNACTGGVGTPMDFFGCSWYFSVGRPISHFDQTIATIRDRLGKYPRFKNLPIDIGEFAVLRDERNKRLYAGDTTEWSASFYAALADRVYAQGIRQLYEWDHATKGVMHPRGRVIEMLEKMAGGKLLPVTINAASPAECGTLAVRQNDDLLLLVYNHSPERRTQANENVRLVLRDHRMAGTEWRISEWLIDRDHASWAYAYEADCAAAGIQRLETSGLYEGNPLRLYGEAGMELFKKSAAKYAGLSVVPQTQTDAPLKVARGTLTLDLELSPHSVRLIKLSPPR